LATGDEHNEEYIELIYYYSEDKQIRLFTQHICKIIDYGRSYANTPETLGLYDKLCNEPTCNQENSKCGKKEGFAWLSDKDNLNAKNSWMSSQTNNISHDLRLYNIYEEYKNHQAIKALKAQPVPQAGGQFNTLTCSLLTDINMLMNPPADFIQQITHAKLNNCKLAILPNVLFKFTELIELDLSYNPFEELPPEIENLTQLKLLRLDGTKISSLPDTIANLHQLTKLWMGVNKNLTIFPEIITSIPSLTHLAFIFSGITSLPDSIGNLQQLQTLLLSSNKLTSLPDSIGTLSQLSVLILDTNPLTHLPENIGSLSQLTFLDISDTLITHLPESMSQLTKLKKFIAVNVELEDDPPNLPLLSPARKKEIIYRNNFGTAPAETDPTKKRARNVQDVKNLIESKLPTENPFPSNYTKKATLNIYLDGTKRAMLYEPNHE